MKTPHIILAIIAAFCLASCADLPVVSNRNAQGQFITPACPKCGEAPIATGTVYVDGNGHPFLSWNAGQAAAAPKLKSNL